MNVSIHAPARGATADGGLLQGAQDVSIHAPARGATDAVSREIKSVEFQSTHPQGVRPREDPKLQRVLMFQSTHPQGVRRLRLSVFHRLVRVSIHAPARGATLADSLLPFSPMFQSTHPQGVRLTCGTIRQSMWSFNPRTRKGCDPAGTNYPPCEMMFQSTHPQGVRRVPYFTR